MLNISYSFLNYTNASNIYKWPVGASTFIVLESIGPRIIPYPLCSPLPERPNLCTSISISQQPIDTTDLIYYTSKPRAC